ncbi:hypothetical protein EDD58_102447 [Hazenella coriacea]|uniref:Uncharacterized protein n=1 Tax=Hazenella coriacea TaxID=1179467 RepID=A0A4R3L9S3_9BACL|nr:hypothetical protein EDD58_102447 [Hazenella coriacea]
MLVFRGRAPFKPKYGTIGGRSLIPFHLLILLLFLGLGLFFLFFTTSYMEAVHYLLIALYLYISLFELLGKPFARWIYLLTMVLLVGDGMLNMFVFSTGLLSGIFSFFLAFLAWKSAQRLKNV